MNTKFCKHCGKELPVESVFCPYCMTKLIDVKKDNPIKSNKKKYIIPILITAVVIIFAVSGAVVFFVVNSNNEIDAANPVTTAVVPTVTQETAKADYTQYIGLWSDKNNDIDNLTENGGNLLEIISVNDDVVRFTFTKTSAYNRIARISNVSSKIIDSTGTFTFDDDGWQNSGTGKIKFIDDEIYLETNITSRNDNAMWDIGGSFYLVKSENSVTDFESYNYLNANFDEVKNHFGEEVSNTPNALDNTDLHTYSGLSVFVNNKTNKIVSITVEYSGIFSKTQLCYGSINGNSTYDDVYAKLGEPIYNNISEGHIGYIVNGNNLYFEFDDAMNVTGFTLKIENI